MSFRKNMIVILLFVFCLSMIALTGENVIKPVKVEKPMPLFKLPTLDGKTFDVAAFKGKKLMLIFPRGYAAKDYWCGLCNYQYAELAEAYISEDWKKKYNVEVAYIFPYKIETVKSWIENFMAPLEVIEKYKNPSDEEKKKEKIVKWAEFLKKEYPLTFKYEKGKVPTPFHILVDADRKVSKGLDLFRTIWGKSQVEQNIPAIFILDENGIVKFKYISQNTFDRPSVEYIKNMLIK